MSICGRRASRVAADRPFRRSTEGTARRLSALFITGSCALSAAHAQDAPFARSMFSEFVGVCQATADPKKPDLWKNIAFIRNDLSWEAIQPNGRDDWRQDYLDTWGQQVLENRRHHVETLPMLGYMAPWAARRRPWSFTLGDTRST